MYSERRSFYQNLQTFLRDVLPEGFVSISVPFQSCKVKAKIPGFHTILIVFFLAVLTSFVQARQRCFVPANRFYSVMCFFCPLCSQQALPQQLQRAAKGQQRDIRSRFYFVFIQ